jgi:hypothetical protein
MAPTAVRETVCVCESVCECVWGGVSVVSNSCHSHARTCAHTRTHTHTGNDSLIAFARANHLNIVIHQLKQPPWEVRENPHPSAQTLHLGYHDEIHYSSLRPLGEDPSDAGAGANVELALVHGHSGGDDGDGDGDGDGVGGSGGKKGYTKPGSKASARKSAGGAGVEESGEEGGGGRAGDAPATASVAGAGVGAAGAAGAAASVDDEPCTEEEEMVRTTCLSHRHSLIQGKYRVHDAHIPSHTTNTASSICNS